MRQRLKAVLFDVDGTLYGQRALRTFMLGKLLKQVAADPRTGIRTILVLRAYRRAQERLRSCGGLPSEQLALCCEWADEDQPFVVACVERWVEREPLDHLVRLQRPGLGDFLKRARQQNVKLGIVSDYPAAAKLAAMGLADFFDVVVSAADPGVNRFKPCPDGIFYALRQLGVDPDAALYVGDRPEVDGEAARSAGVAV